jgi:hypothetical protein
VALTTVVSAIGAVFGAVTVVVGGGSDAVGPDGDGELGAIGVGLVGDGGLGAIGVGLVGVGRLGAIGVGLVDVGGLGAIGVVGGVEGATIWNVDVAWGLIWLKATNVPVSMLEALESPTLGTPFQVVVSVSDCPGCSVRTAIYMGLMPAFDLQTGVPFCTTTKPSMLGPTSTMTALLELFVSVKVSCTG